MVLIYVQNIFFMLCPKKLKYDYACVYSITIAFIDSKDTVLFFP